MIVSPSSTLYTIPSNKKWFMCEDALPHSIGGDPSPDRECSAQKCSDKKSAMRLPFSGIGSTFSKVRFIQVVELFLLRIFASCTFHEHLVIFARIRLVD